MQTNDAAERRSDFASRATRRCGPHHKDAATLYRDKPHRLNFLFGESFGSIYDQDAVGRIEHEVEKEDVRIRAGHPLANPLTLDECVSALIAARWARRFGNLQASA